jgi:hypothetical protein
MQWGGRNASMSSCHHLSLPALIAAPPIMIRPMMRTFLKAQRHPNSSALRLLPVAGPEALMHIFPLEDGQISSRPPLEVFQRPRIMLWCWLGRGLSGSNMSTQTKSPELRFVPITRPGVVGFAF